MPTIRVYLRKYTRWDGTPGLDLNEQRAIARRIAHRIERERNYACPIKRTRRVEGAEGASSDWPVLKKMIDDAKEEAGRLGEAFRVVLVIPTLDGVRFNLSFLQLLAGIERGPICVYAGRTSSKLRPCRNFWRLYDHDGLDRDEWHAFNEVVRRVRTRNGKLPKKIKDAIGHAKDAGKPTGAARHGSHRFTADQLSKGGRVTTAKRRRAADETYQGLVSLLRERNLENRSVREIVLDLERDRTCHGRKIGPTLIWRTLKRLERENAAAQGAA